MGYYINPANETKESFLKREGKLWNGIPKFTELHTGNTFVVLVNNGVFTAAAIAFNEGEYKEFTDPADSRLKKVYEVKTDLLREYCSIL